MSLLTYLHATIREAVHRMRGFSGFESDASKAGAGQERDMDLVRLYHAFHSDLPGSVDEATWQDLSMDEVFAKLDRTVSLPGSQILYHRLRVLESDDSVLEERARQYEVFRRERVWTAKARSVLRRLDGRGAAWLAPLLLSGLPKRPAHAWAFYICSAAPLLCFLGSYWLPPLILGGIFFIVANVILNEVVGARITGYFPAFSQLSILLRACQELAASPEPHGIREMTLLRESLPTIRAVRGRLRVLSMDRVKLPDIVMVAFGYLNLIFLFDIISFFRAIPALERHQGALVAMLESLGSLDASMAVALYLDEGPYATPEFSKDRCLDIRGMYHPLLAVSVSNDLCLEGRSALITGSNMAGKTTFIRALGISVVLGQTLSFCPAESAVLPRVSVRSSIRRSDNLEKSQSYYFAELHRMLAFVQDTDLPSLFLVDEIFRGTNTLERIAASTAVLRYLGKKNMVLATTHDHELGELLADCFDSYHFSEYIVDEACTFDYKIRPGQAWSKNAIRLLEISGFPTDITEEAHRLMGRTCS